MKAIFFDTNIFYSINFDVENELINGVANLASQLDIELWITPITISEIKSGIDRKLDDLIEASKKASQIMKYELDFGDAISPDLVNTVRQDVKENLESFINRHKFRILKYELLDESDISKTFDDYFHQRGAFTRKKRSKSSISKEFPDAFQIELIRRATICGEHVAVVSSDSDFAHCLDKDEGIYLYRSLESLYNELDAILNKKFINRSEIENRILYYLDDFENCDSIFSHLNFYNDCDLGRLEIGRNLESMYDKGLVEKYIFSPETGKYEQASPTQVANVWYKQIN
ncbi:TPA: PIN domain-containing protein [Vibrio diabolicus]|uniref:PIN domain-containing protein n=1 Tax=Vibrio parahaemolyticus TaxID=670 RepID=UPI00111EF5FA|nr:PIN domain-containing protein [Vibrio parahaemolyticus]TOB87507.1 hypothetical protein CGJ97_22240 [Vibrio parahaemolyticus]